MASGSLYQCTKEETTKPSTRGTACGPPSSAEPERQAHGARLLIIGWDDVDQLELTTLGWVHWFNQQRLHGHCDDTPPAEFEAAFYAARQTTPAGAGKPNQ